MSGYLQEEIWQKWLPSPTAKYVLIYMAKHGGHDGSHIWPSQRTVAKATGQKLRTVQKAIADLRRWGLLRVVDGAGGGRPDQGVHYEVDRERLREFPSVEDEYPEIPPFPWARETVDPAVAGAADAMRARYTDELATPAPDAGVTAEAETGETDLPPHVVRITPAPDAYEKKRKKTPDPDPEEVVPETGRTPAPEIDPALHYPEGALFGAPRVLHEDLAIDLPDWDRASEPDPEGRERFVGWVRPSEVPEHHDSAAFTVKDRNCDDCGAQRGSVVRCPRCAAALVPVKAGRR
jgi:hypothetical protein